MLGIWDDRDAASDAAGVRTGITPRALLVSFDLNGLQCNLASDALWCDLGGGISRGHKREWGSTGKVRVGGGDDRHCHGLGKPVTRAGRVLAGTGTGRHSATRQKPLPQSRVSRV